MEKEKKLHKSGKLSERWRIFDSSVKRIEISRSFALLLVSFIVIVLSKISIILMPELRSSYISVIVFQVLIFILPIYIYINIFEKGTEKKIIFRKLGMSGVRFNHIFLIASASVLLICLTLGIDMLFGGTAKTSEGFSLYGTFEALNEGSPYAPFYLTVTFALLPAVCEEITFRGLIESGFRRYGITACILSSAVIYSLLPFSLSRMPAFLFMGIFMSFVMFVTGSVFACIIVHFIYNLFCVFMQANISNYIIASDNNTLLVLFIVFLALISSAVFCGETARILRGYAKTRKTEPGIIDTKFKPMIKQFAGNLNNPYFFICLAFWVVYSVFAAFV